MSGFLYNRIKILTATSLVFLMLLFAFADALLAATNQEINYQGKLTDTGGVAVADGTYNMNFWLVASSTAATSTAIWSEARTGGDRVQVTNGLFSVMLGEVSSLSGVDFNQTLYLGVEIGGTGGTPSWDGEMSPRKIIGSVPAAFVAETANTFDGLATTSFLRADNADTMEATSSSALLTLTQNGSGDILNLFTGATEMFTVLNNGNVGIGTTTPEGRLTVGGSGTPTFVVEASTGSNWFDVGVGGVGVVRFNTGGGYTQVGGTVSSGGRMNIGHLGDSAAALVLTGGAANNIFEVNSTNADNDGDAFVIDDVGNVGIASTTPSSKLTVVGDTYLNGTLTLTGAFKDTTSATGTSGQILSSTGTSTLWTSISGLGLGDGTFLGLSDTVSSYNANRLFFTNSGGTAVTDSADLVFDGTNFGIGIAAPTSRLTVDYDTSSSTGLHRNTEIVTTFSPSTASYNSTVYGLDIKVEQNATADSQGGASGEVGFARGLLSRVYVNSDYEQNDVYGATMGVEYDVGSSASTTHAYGSHGMIFNQSNAGAHIQNAWVDFSEFYQPLNGTASTVISYYSDAGLLGGYVDNLFSYKNKDLSSYITSGTLGNQYGAVLFGNSRLGNDFALPTHTLEVVGDLSMESESGSSSIRFRGNKAFEDREDGFLRYDPDGFFASGLWFANNNLKMGTGYISLGGFGGNHDGNIDIDGSTGRIGIGTSTPSSELTVVGDTYLNGTLTLTGAFKDTTSATGTSGQILSSTGTSTLWTSISGLGLGDGTFLGLSDTVSSYNANRLFFTNSGGTAVTDSADLVFDGTNFGIGTTSPVAKLSVVGEVQSEYFNATSTTATSTFSGSITGVNDLLKMYRDESNNPFFQFGNLTGPVPGNSNTSFIFGGTVSQPHTIGSNTYLSGLWGGYDNILGDDTYATHILGSNHSSTTGTHNIIAGGSYHSVSDSDYGSVFGGSGNGVKGNYTVIVGGSYNIASSTRGTVIGSTGNSVYATGAGIFSSNGSTIDAGSTDAVILGGTSNTIDDSLTYNGARASILGGSGHTISNGDYSTILGGFQSSVGHRFATVLGGRSNEASGEYSLAAGRRAKATASGAFALSDATNADFSVGTANVFGTRFSGGYWLTGGDLGVGTTTPTSKLTVDGNVLVDGSLRVTDTFIDSTNSAGTSGMVLQSTGSGTEWVATSSLGFTEGATVFTDLTDTQSSLTANRVIFTNSGGTALDDSADLVFDGTNLGIGTASPASRLDITNSATSSAIITLRDVIGNVSMEFRAGTSTLYNTFIGVNTGVNNSSGSTNTGVGYNALFSNTTGSNNTANGYQALFNNTTGSQNTAGGYQAMAQNQDGGFNTAYGLGALYGNTSGNNNSAFGWAALYTNTTGVDNTAVGINAGRYIADGAGANATSSDSLYLGYNTRALFSGVSNEIVIGATAIGNGSNSVTLGSTTVTKTVLQGNVGIGTTTPEGRLSLEKLNLNGAGVAGIDQYFSSINSSASAIQYGNRAYINANNTATTTLIGSMTRIKDGTTFGNTVVGHEVQADLGSNTLGENTALSGFGRTFGVKGFTSGDAGGVYEPAGVFGETTGTTQGNAIRGYSSSITTAALLKLFQDTSTFTGTGLLMNFGNTTGSFSSTTASKFVDLQNAGTSMFTVGAYGMVTVGDGTTSQNAGVQIGYGGLCVDNDGTCNASTTGRISSVSSHTGNSDLAEMYFSDEDLKTGEVVYLKGGLSVGRADEETKDRVIGVVSTKPGLLLGFDDESLEEGEEGYPLALSGRVPVKLSTENGPIKKGDELMLSSIPGVAMKATSTGRIIGVALEDFEESRAYSDTYINQFGDDIAKPVYVPIQNNDPRINDGCYYGGGNRSGEEPCIPLLATTTDAQTKEAEALAESEAMEEALLRLAQEKSDRVTLDDGRKVRVGQVVMFVDLGYRYLDDDGKEMVNILLSKASSTDANLESEETIWQRLVSLANNFIDGVLSVFTLKADRVEVKDELCVDGVCLDADDLRQLLEEKDRPEPEPSSVPPPVSSNDEEDNEDAENIETETEPEANEEIEETNDVGEDNGFEEEVLPEDDLIEDAENVETEIQTETAVVEESIGTENDLSSAEVEELVEEAEEENDISTQNEEVILEEETESEEEEKESVTETESSNEEGSEEVEIEEDETNI